MINVRSALLFILLAATLSSCAAIGGIFKAGVWAGILVVVVVIVVLVMIFRRKGDQ